MLIASLDSSGMNYFPSSYMNYISMADVTVGGQFVPEGIVHSVCILVLDIVIQLSFPQWITVIVQQVSVQKQGMLTLAHT